MKNKDNVYFLTLGCSKNDIDTEVMISILDKNLYNVVENPESADIVVVNTCSFILDAKTQSIETLFELAELKNENLKYLVVAGCLGQRYPNDLLDEIPELDAIIGTGEIEKINQIFSDMKSGKREAYVGNINSPYVEYSKRVDFKTTQFVKISEGCNNHCTYCIIPELRGKMRSRPIENILDEVRYLAENGTKEIILIAQNTTDYGMDIYGKKSLARLLKVLNEVEEITWIRVLYMYPEGFNDELVDAMKTCDKVCKYVDMPLQHINDDVLKLMGRRITKAETYNLIEKLRREIPDIIIRTTLIVGFVNETEEAFNELKTFIEDAKLDKVGVFQYSLEEGTPAYKLGDKVSEEEKDRRWNEIMKLQSEISFEKLHSKIGNKYEALIENKDEDSYIGRTYMDAPGIDGLVYIKSDKMLNIGDFYDIIVKDNNEYDIYAEEVN